jgi:hypothetical protein
MQFLPRSTLFGPCHAALDITGAPSIRRFSELVSKKRLAPTGAKATFVISTLGHARR